MMQLIHDVAPGAAQAFHAAGGQANFAQGIVKLAAAGADVINDDYANLKEPMFQDGIEAQAVDTVVAQGIPYFTAVGNYDRTSYESAFRPSGLTACTGPAHDFDPGPGVDVFQRVTVAAGGVAHLSLQWDQPFYSVSGAPGSASDLDICLYEDPPGDPEEGIGGRDHNIGKDALEVLAPIELLEEFTLNVAISHRGGPLPGLLKYVNFGADMTIDEFDTKSSTTLGHANASGAESVGAANYSKTPVFGTSPPVLAAYSSAGGTPILFDKAGRRIPKLVRQKPEIVGPDDTNTTFFPGRDIEPDGFPNFKGTSAAAPHAAALGALLRQISPGLTPAQLYSRLESTAIDMGTSGFDFDSGFGFVSAQSSLLALCAAPPPPRPGAIVGTARGDRLTGTQGVDVIYGLDGADVILGLGGGDIVYGGAGGNFLDGGEGNDLMCGGPAGDSMMGGGGSDLLAGEGGLDQMQGGPGNDALFGGADADVLDGGPGVNTNDGGPGRNVCRNGTRVNCAA